MNILEAFQNLNYIAIAVAAIASYVLGFTWYHWAVFGEVWANALGLTKEEAESTEGLGGAFAASLVSGLVKTLLLALLMSALQLSGVLAGTALGAALAIAFTGTSLAYYNGFARTSLSLSIVNAAHSVVELALIGAILGAFS